MSYIKWNKEATISQFYIGLKDHVKDELTKIDRSSTLAVIVNLAIQIDNKHYERKLEHNRRTPKDKSKAFGNKYVSNKKATYFPLHLILLTLH
jgi:hypothetical protein